MRKRKFRLPRQIGPMKFGLCAQVKILLLTTTKIWGNLPTVFCRNLVQFVDVVKETGLAVYNKSDSSEPKSDAKNLDGEEEVKICNEILELVQALLNAQAHGLDSMRAFWIIVPPTPKYFGVRSLARSIALEHPELKIRFAFCENTISKKSLLEKAILESLLPDILSQPFTESAILNEKIYVPKFKFVEEKIKTEELSASWVPSPHEIYLISGGHRGIGVSLAERLVKIGAKNLFLLGRNLPFGENLEKLEKLKKDFNAEITSFAVDLTDSHQFDKFSEEIVEKLRMETDKGHCFGGIFHAAGVVDDAVILKLNMKRVKFVLDPKISGAARLSNLMDNFPKETTTIMPFLVLFSSTASVFGTAGQSTYAMANGCLDGFALQRNLAGKPTLAVQWGGWDEIGMSADLGMSAIAGERYLKPKDAFACLEILLSNLNSPTFFENFKNCDETTSDFAAKNSLLIPGGCYSPAVLQILDWKKYMTHDTLFFANDPLARELAISGEKMKISIEKIEEEEHPILGVEKEGFNGGRIFEFDSFCKIFEFAKQHRIEGKSVFPGTGYIELANQIAELYWPTNISSSQKPTWAVKDIFFLKPLPLEKPRLVQVSAALISSTEISVRVASKPYKDIQNENSSNQKEESWITHSTAVCYIDKLALTKPEGENCENFTNSESQRNLSGKDLYTSFEDGGWSYGELFQHVESANFDSEKGISSAICTTLAENSQENQENRREKFITHPAEVDAFTHLTSLKNFSFL